MAEMTLRLDPALVVGGLSIEVACRVEARATQAGSGITGQCRKEPVAIGITRAGHRAWVHIGPGPLTPKAAAALLQEIEALTGDDTAP